MAISPLFNAPNVSQKVLRNSIIQGAEMNWTAEMDIMATKLSGNAFLAQTEQFLIILLRNVSSQPNAVKDTSRICGKKNAIVVELDV